MSEAVDRNNGKKEDGEESESFHRYNYPSMTKTQGNFTLHVKEGAFTDSEIIVMLGENGTGTQLVWHVDGSLICLLTTTFPMQVRQHLSV